MSTVIFEPKQKRSEQTLNKLVTALLTLVEQKYFEHITIAEVASEAGVSVGAFYRRFKSKESALPTLYSSFQTDLRDWLETNEALWSGMSFSDLVPSMVRDVFAFFGARAGLVRTLHLNSRLHSEIIKPSLLEQRQSDYQRLSKLLVEQAQSSGTPCSVEAAHFAVFTLVCVAVEKVVYPNLTPAIAAPQIDEQAIRETSQMIQNYLCR